MGARITRFGRAMFPIASGAAWLRGMGWSTVGIAHKLGAIVSAYILASLATRASAAMQQSDTPTSHLRLVDNGLKRSPHWEEKWRRALLPWWSPPAVACGRAAICPSNAGNWPGSR